MAQEGLAGTVKAASEESLTLEVAQKDKTTKEFVFVVARTVTIRTQTAK